MTLQHPSNRIIRGLSLPLVVALVLTLAHSQAFGNYEFGIVQGDNNADRVDNILQAILDAPNLPANATVTIIPAYNQTPVYNGNLENYDALLVYSISGFADSDWFGNELKTFVDNGGGVVVAAATNESSLTPRNIGGDFNDQDYHPLTYVPFAFDEAQLGARLNPFHPVFDGFSWISLDSSLRVSGELRSNTTMLAEYDDGESLVAERLGLQGIVISLNYFPKPTSGSFGYEAWTDASTLTTNALIYAADGVPVPAVMTNTGFTVDEGGSHTIENTELEATDGRASPTDIVYTLTAPPIHATILLDDEPLAAGQTFTQEDIDNGLLVYVHDGSETLEDSFQARISNGTYETLATVFAEIDAVNDPPVLSLPGPQIAAEDEFNYVLSAEFGNPIQVTDPDIGDGDLILTLTILEDDGGEAEIEVDEAAGQNVTVNGANPGTDIELIGHIDEITNILNAGVTITVVEPHFGTVILEVTANDQGNTGQGGPQSDSGEISIAFGETIIDDGSGGCATPQGTATTNLLPVGLLLLLLLMAASRRNGSG